ncbi:F1 complex, delta/epsilon subunit of ATPase [Zychaea mexicana]|uniref:F1 complex, delta/epsilon subunit of ATPase n=1 Tax=Zychaea mexicana TaxID=64656 RepID=UPI0022FDB4AE|nr:F1 complex, delta/epsilon subunit of ATPase [Zychaea mexicana]KAI9497598.1 F1 complex, delta/epsilon subunit of ATPase [Zychaea mexicana]
MNVFARSVRAAIRPALARSYATEAPAADKLRLTFVLPHKALYKSTDVQQVNLAATSGDMGILANHVPTIEQLNPGVVEVIESGDVTKKFFVSGGFAIINPDSTLNINAVEAAALDELSVENVKSALAEAQKVANGAGSDAEKAAAKVEVEVYEAIENALSK